MDNVIAIILAAGEGKRMNSKKSKVVQKIYGKEMIKRILDTSKDSGIKENIVVIGHLKEQVIETLGDTVKYAVQNDMLGTGHAVMQANEYLEGRNGKVVILYGDAPITKASTIKSLIEKNISNSEFATIVTAVYDNPPAFGRIIRNEDGNVKGIVEQKDATEEQKAIKEVNCGIYCFDIQELLISLNELKPNNAQNEYYLTDVVQIMAQKGLKVGTYIVEDVNEMIQPNDKKQLAEATNVLKLRINEEHMRNGVTIIDPNNTYIYDNVEIGRDTVIYPGTIIESNVKIGEDCEIGPCVYIKEGSVVSDHSKIESFKKINN